MSGTPWPADAGNRTLVYNLIWRQAGISRTGLVEKTGLTKSTVSVLVSDLLARGLIKETGMGRASVAGGRRPLLLEVDANSRVVAGVHVGVRQTTVILADAIGSQLAVHRTSTMRNDPTSTIKAIAGSIVDLLEASSIPRDKLSAVGLALPGLVGRGGVCVLAPNLGWRDVAVSELLGNELSVPVFTANTSQAMAVAEAGPGSGQAEDDLALLYVGTGVGCGIVTGGQLFRGSSGFAGEIGHVSMGSGILCSCGKTGCLETLVSGPAIVRRAQELGIGGDHQDSLTPAAIGQAAAGGDAAAQKLLTQVGIELGHAAAWIVQMANPRALVLAGGLSDLGDLLIDPLTQGMRESALPELITSVAIRRSRLDSAGKLRGAVLVALQQLSEIGPE